MRKIAVIVLILGISAAGIGLFKVEHVGEVCALTGASRQYTRYFSVLKTRPVYQDSWIDRTLAKHGVPVPPHRWVQTMGNTSTAFVRYRAHGPAPLTYSARSWTESLLLDTLSEEEILQLAEDFASGDEERQQNAVTRLYDQ